MVPRGAYTARSLFRDLCNFDHDYFSIEPFLYLVSSHHRAVFLAMCSSDIPVNMCCMYDRCNVLLGPAGIFSVYPSSFEDIATIVKKVETEQSLMFVQDWLYDSTPQN